MLSKDLLRVTVRKGEVKPTFVAPDSPKLVEAAEGFLALARSAEEEGWTRGELRAGFEEQIGDDRQVKLLRGLIKLVLDRCEFDVSCPVPPVELRAEVFAAAVEARPLDLERGVFGRKTAEDVLAEVGAKHGLDAQQVADALYGDLKDAQVVVSTKLPDSGTALLHRYNVALVQAVLYDAVSVTVRLEKPTPGRVRQLLRHAKFQQLMHEARRDGSLLELRMDGPAAVLKQSSRYGLALAKFFPALLLQEGPWHMEAALRRRGRDQTLRIDHDKGLVSHLRDTGAYEPKVCAWFRERWEAKAPEGVVVVAGHDACGAGRARGAVAGLRVQRWHAHRAARNHRLLAQGLPGEAARGAAAARSWQPGARGESQAGGGWRPAGRL